MKKLKLSSLLFVVLITLISCSQNEILTIADRDMNDYANTVSIEEARIELDRLLDDIYVKQSTKSDGCRRKVISNSFTIKDCISVRSDETDSLIIHVFNFENHGGFALMTGNRELPSLLALSNSGEITESAQISNPGFGVFASNMEKVCLDKMELAALGGERYTYTVYGEWENIVYEPEENCQVKWGQNNPYNMYCPLKNDKKTLTGCVATAVAQFMSIYKHPSSFNGYTFDWEKMTEKEYGFMCDTVTQSQIAHLMFELGKSSNLSMSYNTIENGGSGSDPKNIPRTLQNFGYSNGGQLEDYNTDKVVAELKNGYSVLVGGHSHKTEEKFLGITIKTTYSGGHRWLCHGLLERKRTVYTYVSDGSLLDSTIEQLWYPLCNWGWDGYQDGYYLSNAFNSNDAPFNPIENKCSDAESVSQEGNYQYNTTVVIGIRK